MMEKIKQYLPEMVILLLAVLLRLAPHPGNVSPINSLALFGGAYFSKRYGIVLPLVALFVSDLFLGFHATMPFVYGSFILTGLLGYLIRKKRGVFSLLGMSVLSSVLFYFITNSGVWILGNMYPLTFSGYLECLVAGIPFFRNTLIGDLFYITFFYGAFALCEKVCNNSGQGLSYANLYKKR